MHDLRKQVLLESKKTTSRKARSKITTPSSSKATSPARSSRAASRATSDDDEETSLSESGFATQDAEELSEEGASSSAELYEVMDGLVDRKRSSTEGREERLRYLGWGLCRRVCDREVKARMGEVVPAVVRMVKAGEREREVVLALWCLGCLVVTLASEGGNGGEVYEELAPVVKTAVEDSMESAVKVAALHALALAVFYGGAAEVEVQEVMEWLLEIAASDGVAAGAEDDAEVVKAALEGWGFLATKLEVEAIEEVCEHAMETFIDQLGAGDAGVQVAAGENVALIYEKSYAGADDSDDDDDDDDNHMNNGHTPKSAFTPTRDPHALTTVLQDLTRQSSKRISKADRKTLHQAFRDIFATVENPSRGPRYSSALDDEGREYGSRLKVKLGGETLVVDAWWKLLRLKALRRVLKGGVGVHLEGNAGVARSLPVEVE
ncbi:hypothetical protein MBLNU230_g3956t1 [Neophaeotheca triangularis]